MATDVRDVLREEASMLDATTYLDPKLLAKLATPAVFHYRKSRAFELRVASQEQAEKLARRVHRQLISKRRLTAADVHLHDLHVFVSWPGGYVSSPAESLLAEVWERLASEGIKQSAANKEIVRAEATAMIGEAANFVAGSALNRCLEYQAMTAEDDG